MKYLIEKIHGIHNTNYKNYKKILSVLCVSHIRKNLLFFKSMYEKFNMTNNSYDLD